MLRKLIKLLTDLIADRTVEIEHEIQLKDPEYNQIREAVVAAQTAVIQALPARYRNLITRYEHAQTDEIHLMKIAMYRQGLLDGMKLGRIVKKSKV